MGWRVENLDRRHSVSEYVLKNVESDSGEVHGYFSPWILGWRAFFITTEYLYFQLYRTFRKCSRHAQNTNQH